MPSYRPPMSTIPFPSQTTFVTSLALYPLTLALVLQHYSSPSHTTNASPRLIAITRTSLSAVHSTIITVLSLRILHQHSAFALLTAQQISNTLSHRPAAPTSTSASSSSSSPFATHPLITTVSPAGNALTAYETGYRAQDTVLLLYLLLRSRSHSSTSRSESNVPGPPPQQNAYGIAKSRPTAPPSPVQAPYTKLLAHHIPVLLAFAALQLYLYLHPIPSVSAHSPISNPSHDQTDNPPRGILVITLLQLQHASTPLSSVRTIYVLSVPRRERRTRVLMALELVYLFVYGIARLGVVLGILAALARWCGSSGIWGLVRVLGSLRWYCAVGAGGMVVWNAGNWGVGWVRWVGRYCVRGVGKVREREKMGGGGEKVCREGEGEAGKGMDGREECSERRK